MSQNCSRCEELTAAVDQVLDKLVSLTNDQLKAFRQREDSTFTRLDKELELTVGVKERMLGALREHRQGHGQAVELKAS